MNRTEAEYAQLLELQRKAGEIDSWAFEALKLRLAKRTWYTPDFLVMVGGLVQLHEVKGFWRDDARVKIKVAAETFPAFQFIAVTKKSRRLGAWHFEWF